MHAPARTARTAPGARVLGDGTVVFDVWAPRAERVEVVFDGSVAPMARGADDRHTARVAGVGAGDTYRFRLHRADGTSLDRADPASRHQPHGVHGPSAIDVPAAFGWTDAGFRARPLHEQVLYELHVGTFSPDGTFDGVIRQLDHLVELGVTTIELLPVWQFPGGRNWGYDGVANYAVQDTYGGPEGLRRLVDAAHAAGIGVILDVVYNHVGPEGNVLGDFGPYFTDRRSTPWGDGLNADGEGADEVRRYVIGHAVTFVRDFHLDGFRLDAVHGIVDTSAVHLLEELAAAVHAEAARLGRHVQLIAESDLCDPRLLRPPEVGGYGLDAQWGDEFHHAVHVALTGERDGYYGDFRGLADLAPLLRDRFLHAGRYSAFRGRTIGRPARDLSYDHFVVCVQNHDQVGNRMLGERLSVLVDAEAAKLAAAALLTSPFVPMLFMGEEYAEPAPFPYFVSHTDPALVEAVRTGRAAEFAAFGWQTDPPDPQATTTYDAARIDVALADREGVHAQMFALYRDLIALRSEVGVIARPAAPDPVVTTVPGHQAVALYRAEREEAVLIVLNGERDPVEMVVADAPGPWSVRLSTADVRYGGPGPAGVPSEHAGGVSLTVAPRSATVLVRELSAAPVPAQKATV